MQKLNFEIKEKKVEINGIEFKILKDDFYILSETKRIGKAYQNLKEDDLDGMASAIEDFRKLIVDCLGEGSLEKISANNPVGISMLIFISQSICKVVVQEFADSKQSEYE